LVDWEFSFVSFLDLPFHGIISAPWSRSWVWKISISWLWFFFVTF
jgi:hypothetical protein